ncbi:MAG: DUF2877 domain-containing protein [Clostridiales bacterium]|nr:DUF2877 domain-containing protein [Clostridiales bacterium]
MTETARKICKRLHAYLRMGNYDGTVHAVYPDAIYCNTSIGMISILSNAHCLSPFSAIVSSVKPFTRYEIEEGQQVLMGNERIEIPDCELVLDLSQTTDYDLSLDTIQAVFLPNDYDIRLRHIMHVIETNANGDDLSPLVCDLKPNEYSDTVKPHLMKLHTAFRDQDPALCKAVTSAIAGIGVGLIPSADRLLCGYIAGYAALSAALGRSFNRVLEMTRTLAGAAAQHTTELSGAFLLQSGEGLVSEDLYVLVRNVLSDAPYATLVSAANRIAALPLGGGTDMLAGVYLSLSMLYSASPIE